VRRPKEVRTTVRRPTKRLSLFRAATLVLAVALPAEVAQATFPGANGKIAFERSTVFAAHDIYAINPDGSGEINLTHNGANNRQVAWSPDGSRIAFFSDGDGLDDDYNIYVAKADGSGPVRVADTGNAGSPAWSPDGRSIAFEDGFIYTVHPDGTGLRVLIGTGRSGYPAWSPDGSKIAFAHDEGSSAPDIYVANTDGSGMRRVTDDSDETNGWSSWSPDGTRIAYSAGRAGCEPFGCLRVYVVNADGTNRRMLTDDYGFYPTWAPDGSKIAFQAFRGSGQQIYTINPDGTGETRLTNSEEDNHGPEWSPDSTQLVFSRSSSNPPGLDVHVVNRDGTGERYVTDGSAPQWQPIPLPRDAKRLCKAERRRLGNKAFRARYGPVKSSSAAFRNCVARPS